MSQMLSLSYEWNAVCHADSKRTTRQGDGGRSSHWRPSSCKVQLRWANPAAHRFGSGDARGRPWEWTEWRHRRRARHDDFRSTFRDGYVPTTHTTSHYQPFPVQLQVRASRQRLAVVVRSPSAERAVMTNVKRVAVGVATSLYVAWGRPGASTESEIRSECTRPPRLRLYS